MTRTLKVTALTGCFALASVIAGCGAENAQGSGENIGQTSAALSVTSPYTPDFSTFDTDANTPGTQAPDGREYAGSCVIHDGGVDKIAMAGGFKSTGAALGDILIFDPAATNKWAYVKAANGLGTVRGNLRGIQIPGHTDMCLFVDGSSTYDGAAIARADLLSTNGSGTYTVSHVIGMTTIGDGTARAKFQLSTCGTKIIKFLGESSNTPISTNMVEYWDYSSPGSWTVVSNVDSNVTARYNFGLYKDGDNFVLGNGIVGGSPDNTVDLLRDPCGTVAYGSGTLNTTRQGSVLVPERNTAHRFIAALGANGSTLRTDTDAATVTWGVAPTSPSLGTNTNTASVNTGVFLPTLVDTGSVSLALGGENNASGTSRATITSNNVQERGTSWATATSLVNSDRVGAVAEYLPSQGKVYVLAGVKIAAGVKTFVTKVEEVTP